INKATPPSRAAASRRSRSKTIGISVAGVGGGRRAHIDGALVRRQSRIERAREGARLRAGPHRRGESRGGGEDRRVELGAIVRDDSMVDEVFVGELQLGAGR